MSSLVYTAPPQPEAVLRGIAPRCSRRGVAAALLLFAVSPAGTQEAGVAVTESARDAACRQTASRARETCEPAKTVVKLERELSFSIELPAASIVQCAAAIELEYTQRGASVRVTRTLSHRDCGASNGEYAVLVRVRGVDGESRTLEFPVSWERMDDAAVVSTTDFDIGDDVDLLGVRTRQTRCTCAASRAATPRQP